MRTINIPRSAAWLNSKHASELHGVYLAVADAMERNGIEPDLSLLRKVKPTAGGFSSQQVVLYCREFDLDEVPELQHAPFHNHEEADKQRSEETRKLQKLHAVIVTRYQQCGVKLPVPAEED